MDRSATCLLVVSSGWSPDLRTTPLRGGEVGELSSLQVRIPLCPHITARDVERLDGCAAGTRSVACIRGRVDDLE
jgi:hypothetical protein